MGQVLKCENKLVYGIKGQSWVYAEMGHLEDYWRFLVVFMDEFLCLEEMIVIKAVAR